MILAALLLASALFSAFWFADNLHINSKWVFFILISLSFFPTAGWRYRAHFRSLQFAAFLLLWMLLHGLIFVAVMNYFGWGVWVFAVIIELFLFPITASLIFKIDIPTKEQ